MSIFEEYGTSNVPNNQNVRPYFPYYVLFYISYIRHLSYCFYIAVNRICVAISRVDGALKPWSAIHLGAGNSKQKPAYLDLPVPVM